MFYRGFAALFRIKKCLSGIVREKRVSDNNARDPTFRLSVLMGPENRANRTISFAAVTRLSSIAAESARFPFKDRPQFSFERGARNVELIVGGIANGAQVGVHQFTDLQAAAAAADP